MKHLADLHVRHPLTDKGSKLLRDFSSRYATLKLKHRQVSDENAQLKLKLEEMLVLRQELNQAEAEIAVLKPGKAMAEERADELQAEMEALREETVRERALLQKMLDELKQQFDLTVERELLAMKQANALREQNSSLNETLATERATHAQQAAHLQQRAEELSAKAEAEELAKQQLEKLFQRSQHEWELTNNALQQQVRQLTADHEAAQKRELTLQHNLQQTLTEARVMREQLLQATTSLQERDTQLADSRRREEQAIEAAKRMEAEFDQHCQRWIEENSLSKQRELALTEEQFKARLALAQEQGSNRELAQSMQQARNDAEHARSFMAPWAPFYPAPAGPAAVSTAGAGGNSMETFDRMTDHYHDRLREIDQHYPRYDPPAAASERHEQEAFKARFPLTSAELFR